MIDPDGLMCRLYRLNLTLICSFINSVEWNLEIDTHWLLLWLWLLLWYLIGSCATLLTVIDPLLLICRQGRLISILILLFVDSIDRDRPRLAHVLTQSTVFEKDWLICQLFRLRMNMIDSCIDSVKTDRPWLAHMSTLSNYFDPVVLICRLSRMKSWNRHSLASVLTLVTFMVPDLMLSDFVGCVEWNHEIDTHRLLCRLWWFSLYLIWSCATLSTVIDPLLLICQLCRLRSNMILFFVDSVDRDRPRLADVSTLSTVFENDLLMWRLFRLWLNMIESCIDSVNIDRPWLAHMSTLSTEFYPDMLICRLCRMKKWNRHSLAPVSNLVTFMIPNWILCEFVDCDRPSYFHFSTMSTEIEPDPLLCRLCWPWSAPIGSCVDSVDCFWKRLAHVSTLSTENEHDRLMYRLCQHWLTLTGWYVDFVD